MHSATLWNYAPRPNYVTNIDREYPYSGMPFFAKYDVVKIPISPNELIDHVDYWGEGRIVTERGTTGFSNCYNVNHSYRLVSNGPDKDKKIPNRIPVDSYSKCDTSAYIRDNSVLTVTVAGASINESCATDIARIVKEDVGRVIVFGSDDHGKGIKILTNLLERKSLYYCPHYEIPKDLQGITQHEVHRVYLNYNSIHEEFLKLYNKENYEQAVQVIKQLDNEKNGKAINEIVMKLLKSKSNGDFKLMSFAYALWKNGESGIVRHHFPDVFKFILSEDEVTIMNYGYKQPLKLSQTIDEWQDRLVWGHGGALQDFSWQFLAVWENNEVTFKLHNVDYNMYLKLNVNTDQIGDRDAWGSKGSSEDRHRYFVEPHVEEDGTIIFYIINYKYRQGLKLSMYPDSFGDRKLWGHKGNIYAGEDRYKWCISQ